MCVCMCFCEVQLTFSHASYVPHNEYGLSRGISASHE